MSDNKNNVNTTINESDLKEFIIAPEANLHLPEPTLVSYYKDYKSRCLWIDKDIDDSLFNEIKSIIQWNREDEENKIPVDKRTPIIMMIHSYGGNLDACYALIDIMNLSKTPIYTVNLQCALSAGCMILINGHKRFCMPLSQALIHSGSSGNGGTYEQVVSQTENYKKVIEMMQNNILGHTSIDQKTWKKWKGKEIYLYAEDQLKWGLVDEIIDDITKIL